jgi:hypothetical protein
MLHLQGSVGRVLNWGEGGAIPCGPCLRHPEAVEPGCTSVAWLLLMPHRPYSCCVISTFRNQVQHVFVRLWVSCPVSVTASPRGCGTNGVWPLCVLLPHHPHSHPLYSALRCQRFSTGSNMCSSVCGCGATVYPGPWDATPTQRQLRLKACFPSPQLHKHAIIGAEFKTYCSPACDKVPA